MSDTFASFVDSPTSPARQAFLVVPHDSQELQTVTKAIYVGIGGNINLRAIQSPQDVVLMNVQSGSIIDVQVLAVRANGTTAANIVGLA